MSFRSNQPFFTRRGTMLSAAILALGCGPVAAAKADPPPVRPIQAFPIEVGQETRATLSEAPHSALSAESALAVAHLIATRIPGAEVRNVMPTGSMRPMFDERAFIVVEPTPFEDLAVGDIITYLHPRLQVPIVHRILEKREKGFWTKGDHNQRPDDVYVTPANYLKRVVAIIYAREDGARAGGNVPARMANPDR
ncbi:MAG TPA: signal peptidase I [Opitutus sp.]|nr:signal peptidase I [Opitutus sp.]